MKKLRIKLLLSLIAFAFILVLVVSYVNRQIVIADTHKQMQQSRELIENHILTDMQTVDNAHYYFDTTVSNDMEEVLHKLKDKYAQEPTIHTWDLEQVKEAYGYDIYILDESNTVVHTTFYQDLGFNFSDCCASFSSMLDQRRASGEFYTDGIDVSTTTGEIRKFSYLATDDKKFLLEVGVNLNEVPVFQTFNFVKTANYLIDKYEDLAEVKTINSGGVFLDDSQEKRIKVEDMPKQFQKHFNTVKTTMEPSEYVVKQKGGFEETYRFIPYQAEENRGRSTSRIIYIKYTNHQELAALAQNTKQATMLLGVALITAILMVLVISRMLAKTFSLATYDALTGVYNRATYMTKIDGILSKRGNNTPGLLLVDLDNFKQANDQFGHAIGDKVLIETAKVLSQAVGKDGFVVRLGGDEFGIVVYHATEGKLAALGETVLTEIRNLKHKSKREDVWSLLSVSLGGAISDNPGENELSLFERADRALYKSKNSGKDRYSSYNVKQLAEV